MFIEGKNLVKKYGKGDAMVWALNHADFEIGKGEIAVILGPSGSGKSTLLNILGGLDTADEGSITVDGEKISDISQKALEKYRRNDLGFVFQSYNLTPDLTALENVEMTAELTADPLNTAELMEKLGLGAHLHHFPKELSGGQQQRVAIARAMVKKPKLLLCDELTGALDSKSSKEVLQLIEQVNRDYGTTIVIITHNELIAGMADRVLRIKDGKVVSDTVNNAKIKAEEMEL